jgi:hypothetical protein
VLVFWKERFVLLAVPKTGTTALEGALAPRASLVLRDPPTVKHAPVYRYARFVAPLLAASGGEGFETVAVVREPVSWLSSWYRYRHRDDLVGHPNSTRGISLDDFVREYARGKPAPFASVGSQAKFVCDGEGKVAVTHLFRYEEPAGLLAFLAERLGPLGRDLPRLNVSPVLEVALSAEVEGLLREKRAAEFSVWAQAGR